MKKMEIDEKECPYCAETIKAKAVKCKHCGEMLGDALRPEPEAPAAAPVQQPTAVAQDSLDTDILFKNEKISVTARVIQVGTEVIQVANIDSVRTIEVAGISPTIGNKGCGGCLAGSGVLALMTLFVSMSDSKYGPGVTLFWLIFTISAFASGGYLLSAPEQPAPPPTYTIQILHGLIPRDIAKGWSRDDAIALEKAVNEAFQRLRAAR